MYFNIMITMLLGGLWHGASWNFVFWGGLHGVALAVHKGWMSWNPLNRLRSNGVFDAAWSFVSRGLTLLVVLLGWIFFRAESWGAATQFLLRLVTWSSDGTRLVSPYILPALAGVVLVHLFVQKDRLWAEEIVLRPAPVRIMAYSCLAILLVCLAATDSVPFIYFQF